MVLPPPFQGSASAVDGNGGGGSSSVTNGLGSVGGIGDVTGGAPTHLTNMAGPCVGQTTGANCSGTTGVAMNGGHCSLRCGLRGSGEEGCGGRRCSGGHGGRRPGA
ncbi:putative glycine-rich cell wall structural protein 1 [Miscanthus floridulus]|uniref:putative glycine-rich cell wall structural protein 1 n=1 Tax=Miscanthus floridulus TaxID=154761 RepID=UPI003459F33F